MRAWSAPGRINLIGEHVDYAGGLCLPFATEQRTVVTGRVRSDSLLRIRTAALDGEWTGTLEDIGPGRPSGWAGYAAGVPWALHRARHRIPGLDLTIRETVPLGAGMSSSAALCCAVGLAVDELAGLGLSRTEIAAAAQRAENEVVGVPTGNLDQLAVLNATAGHAVLLDCADGSHRQIPLQLGELAVLVIDTGVRHALADGAYADRRATVGAAEAELGPLRHASLADVVRIADPVRSRRARHVVTEIDRVRRAVEALETGRLTELGPLLDASHASLRDDFEVSCVELEVTTAAARDAGALGARMVGGGFGGSAIALVPRPAADHVRDAVENACRAAGFAAPRGFLSTPSAGAGSADV